jgi:hypothetical protein
VPFFDDTGLIGLTSGPPPNNRAPPSVAGSEIWNVALSKTTPLNMQGLS